MSRSVALAHYKRLLSLLPPPLLSPVATTTNAVAVTVDTGYVLQEGHSAKLDGGMNVSDATANTTSSKNFNAALKNFTGTPVVAGSSVAGTVGDGSLSTATLSFSFSGGTLHVTFTPPGGYVGTLNWEATINPTLN